MAANLQPISSDGGFTSGGNININNGSDIITAINEDLNIIVQDEEDDGWALKQTITDGIGNNLSQTTLDRSSFTIDLEGGDQWQFDGNMLQVTTDSTIRGFNANVVTQAMVSGGSPVASLQVVNSVNDPNIYSTFDATSTGANIKVYNGGSSGGTEYAWQFDNTGNLTLPGNTFAVNYANGAQVSIGGGGNTGNVTFSDQIVIGTGSNDGSGGLYLAPGNNSIANSALQYLRVRGGDVVTHIHLDTGNNAFYDQYFGNDAKYVKLEAGATGNVVIGTDDANGNQYSWSFTSDGNLILAGGESVIQSVANSSLDPINPNVSTMILTPSVGYSSQSLVLDPTLPGHIHLRAPSSNIDEPLANIFLGGEDSSFEVGYYNGSIPNVFIHSGGNTWTFDNGGNLLFPRDTGPNTTDPILTIVGGANPSITSTDASLAGPANLGISALNTIFTGFSGDAIKIYPDDGEISSTANLQIWTNSGGNTEYSWTFDDTGNLTVPGNTKVSTAESTGGAAGKNISVVAGAADQSDFYTTSGGNVNITGGLGASNDGGGGGIGGSVNISAGLSADPVGNAGNVVINVGGSSYTFNELTLNVSTNPPASPAPILNGFGVISAPEFTNGNSNVTINANSSIWTFDSTGNLTLPNIANVSINYANGSPYGGGGGGSYGDSNVATFLGSYGSNTISTTGNISAGNVTATANIRTGGQIQSTAFTGGNISWSANNQTDFQGSIKIGGTGRILSPGGAESVVVNNNGANIPQLRVSSAAAANSTTSGSLIVSGGAGIAGNVYIGGLASVTGNITGGNISATGTVTATGKIGYASGSTVTQTTNRGNGVTINALAGTIVTVSATMVAGQIDTFSVANDQVDPNNDIVLVQIVSPNFGVYNCVAQPSATISTFLNGFYINIQNISGFTTSSDAITIRFMVIKAPNA
jgi:hypothetical protein